MELKKKSDVTLLGRAIKHRWDISDELKAKTVRTLRELLDSDDERMKAQAAKVLATIEAQNQRDEHVNADLNEFKRKVIELALEHGIDRTVLGIEEAG